MDSFAIEPDPIDAYVDQKSELLGLMEFTQWEADSGRLDSISGSEWWRAVNGGMMLDIQASSKQVELYGTEAESDNPRIQAWIDYKLGHYKGAGGAQRALWRAHQRSLHHAIDCVPDLLERESLGEQEFITTVVENVDLSAYYDFPSDEVGSVAMGIFLSEGYPDYGQATMVSAAEASMGSALAGGVENYVLFASAKVIGMESTWYWNDIY